MRRKREADVVAWTRTGDEYMSIASSLEQAVQALELASELAVQRGSSEDLTGAAHGWMRMSETIHGINTAAMAQADGWGSNPKSETGFRAPQPAKIDDDSEIVTEEEDVD